MIKNRIPGIDILLKDKSKSKNWKSFFKTIFIPGHTKGHVAFYFRKMKKLYLLEILFFL